MTNGPGKREDDRERKQESDVIRGYRDIVHVLSISKTTTKY